MLDELKNLFVSNPMLHMTTIMHSLHNLENYLEQNIAKPEDRKKALEYIIKIIESQINGVRS